MEEESKKPFNCCHCEKVFSYKRSLSHHIKEKHDKSGAEKSKLQFICDQCGQSFSHKHSMRRHINAVHLSSSPFLCDKCTYITYNKSNLERHMHKIHFSNRNVPKRFACSYCVVKFAHKGNLRRHEKRAHDIQKHVYERQINRKCPLCSFTSNSPRKNEINTHFSEVHKLSLRVEKHSFDSLDDFSRWKDNLEKSTMTLYVKKTTYTNRVFYQCHRKGNFKRSGTIRCLKIDGSCKINGHCPSEIKVKISESGSVSVSYLATHVGHTNKLRFTKLTSMEKQLLASEILQKTPEEEVTNLLKKLKNTRTPVVSAKKDILNKENLCLNGEAEIHQFDGASVEARVKELSSAKDTALLIYKLQGQTDDKFPKLKEGDFLLIFMSEGQKSLLESRGKDIVCINITNTNAIGLDNYNFQLYTLHTFDEYREGFPCAYMFTNKGDEFTLSVFFKGIKEITGSIRTNVFISDMEEAIYSAWISIMGTPNLRLFSTWALLRAWRSELNKIKIKEKRDKVFNALKTVLYELNVDMFHKIMSSDLEKLDKDSDTKEFSEYFMKQYVTNEYYKYWAYCYRTNSGVNTNISLETFNKVLKSCYIKGITEQRLEKTIFIILHFLRDKLHHIVKTVSGKLKIKLQDLRKRHKRALIIPSTNIVQNGCKWNVLTSNGTLASAVKKVQDCKRCWLQCTHCNSCFHEFVCTCRDNSMKNNMCDHIHAVARSIIAENQIQSGQNTQVLYHNIKDEPIFKEIIVAEIKTESSNEIDKKNEIRGNFEMLLERIATDEQLEFVHQQVKEMLANVNNM